MNKNEFNRAISIADKYINTRIAGKDKTLTENEVNSACKDAETYIRAIFPSYGKKIKVQGYRDTKDNFAGYVLTFGNLKESAEFDFGAHGIDVV